jgi:hypothetical protein
MDWGFFNFLEHNQINQPVYSGDAGKPSNYTASNYPPTIKSYSAVAAHKQPNSMGLQNPPLNTNIPNVNRVNGKMISPQEPIQNVTSPNNRSGPPFKQEQLDIAKQQMIADNRRQAASASPISTTKPSSVTAAVTTSTSTVTITQSTVTTSQTMRQSAVPPSSPMTDTSSAPKTSYSRMTATTKTSNKSEAIAELQVKGGTTPRGQGELSKYGKVINLRTNEEGMFNLGIIIY